MSNSPEDIIELTDIIEHGPGTDGKSGADGGVDLSFERELEDLFAESPTDKPAQGAQQSPGLPDLSDLPGLDDLHLPEENAKGGAGDDIDLDGLDALLAEAEKSGADASGSASGGVSGDASGLGDLPELTDDFLSDVVPKAAVSDAGSSDLSMFDTLAAPAVAAGAAAVVAASLGEPVSSPATDALSARLDDLEEKVRGLGDSLDAIKADAPADPSAMLAELKESLEQQVEALRTELSALPAPAEPVDAEALAAQISQVEARVDEKLADLQAASEPQPDAASMIAELKESLEQQNEALKAELSALVPPAQEPLDEAALAERVKQEVLSALPEPAAQPEPADAEALAAQIEAMAAQVEARLDEKLADLQAASESQADPASMIAELKESLEQQNEALKSELFALAAPQESSQPVDEEALAERVKQEVLSALPAPAAAPEGDGAGEALAKVQELSGRVDAELAEVMARIEAVPAPADTAALADKLDDLAARQEQILARLDALEAKPAAPDLGGLVSRDELAALRQSILDEMQKAVPAAAAKIIREEIQALVREMD